MIPLHVVASLHYGQALCPWDTRFGEIGSAGVNKCEVTLLIRFRAFAQNRRTKARGRALFFRSADSLVGSGLVLSARRITGADGSWE
jgi:hypothetical protein